MAKVRMKEKTNAGHKILHPETLALNVITGTGNVQGDITNIMNKFNDYLPKTQLATDAVAGIISKNMIVNAAFPSSTNSYYVTTKGLNSNFSGIFYKAGKIVTFTLDSGTTPVKGNENLELLDVPSGYWAAGQFWNYEFHDACGKVDSNNVLEMRRVKYDRIKNKLILLGSNEINAPMKIYGFWTSLM